METPGTEQNRRMEEIAEALLRLKWRMNPVAATALGVHDWDDTLGSLMPESLEDLAREFASCRRELQSEIEPTLLSPDEYTDYRLAMSLASSSIIRLECLREWEHDPSVYPARAMWGLHVLLIDDITPAEERARHMVSRLREAPEMLILARRNLRDASKLLTRIGMESAERSIGFLRQTIPTLAEGLPSLASDLLEASEHCADALRAYREWLENDLLPRAHKELAIGADLYEQLVFAEHQLTYSPEDIVRLGQGALISAQDSLEDTAQLVDPAATWQELIHRLRREHPSAEELLPVYRQAVSQASEFVRVGGLVTFPEADRLDLLPTPEFQRSTFPHAAYMPPPPFAGSERHGHFWVTPIDPSAAEEDREQRLEGHTIHSIPITALHQSYPGHHLQFSISNEIGNAMRKQSVSHLFAEGWALYCEEMMYEQGFCTDPRVRLFQIKDSLRHACRVLVDVGLHTGEMTFHGAVGLLVETARLDEAAAVAEVRRHACQPGRAMTHMIGKLLVLSIREEQKRRLGSRFDLREFHDQLLSYGTIPTSLIAERFASDGRRRERRAA